MEEYNKKRIRADMNLETRIPLIGEELKVYIKQEQKRASKDKKGTCHRGKTVEVPVTHEVLEVERRPAQRLLAAKEGPVTTDTDVTIPLTSEQVDVTKEPYIKEEVVIVKSQLLRQRVFQIR